ncbi:MAG: type II secretion system protein N [Burkholderiales bacterium]|nr:type II secretion system protein N [Burkholderiales bacterium]
MNKMYTLTRLYERYRKFLIGIIFFVIFFITLFNTIPTWVLGSLLNKYSAQKLKLYDTHGTFWDGSGLLVATDPKSNSSAPLILLNWKIKLGMTKFVDMQFFVGNNNLANIYLDKKGVNLNNLNMSLSIGQVTELFGIIKNLGLSGNVNISTNQMILGKTNQGTFNIKLTAVSSSISPVNPLGNYNVVFNTDNRSIKVSSSENSSLTLNGEGSVSELILKGKVATDKKDKLLQFITVMGSPQPDGTYSMKIF